MKILGVTGHRPQKLAPMPDCYSDEVLKALIKLALKKLRELEPDKVITGMALGWDTACAIAALHLGVPIVAAVPFQGQESKWPTQSQKRYHRLLEKICENGGEVVIVSQGGYSSAKMLKRDEYIVDTSHVMLSLWDGSPTGGTAHTIKCAKNKKLKIVNAWSDWKPE